MTKRAFGTIFTTNMNITYTRDNGQKALKLIAVSVIEMSGGELQSTRTFVDNPEGNQEAEKLFRKLVAEHEDPESPHMRSDEEDFVNYLDEGVYEDCSGYQLFITHSV